MLRSTLAFAVVVLGGTLYPSRAAARPAPVLAARKTRAAARKNIAVGHIDGPKSSKIRLSLMQALRESPSFTVTDAEDLKAKAGKSAIAKLAASLSVDAVVLGTVSSKHDLTLNVYKADGRLVDQIKVRGGSSSKLESAIEDQFDSTLAPPIAHASGAKLKGHASAGAAPVEEEEEEEPEAEEAPKAEPPADETEPAEAPVNSKLEEPNFDENNGEENEGQSDKEKSEAKAGEAKPGRTPFELTAGIRGYSRHWKYSGLVGVRDPRYPRTLEPYNLGFAPSLLVNGVLYPAAFWTDNVLANIGIMAGAELGVATSTNYVQVLPDGSKLTTGLKTQAQAWDVGLRGRLPLGPAELALFVEYGSQSFILHGDEGGTGLGPLVPDVQYRYIRPGVEGRLRFGRFSIAAHVAPRFLLTLHDVDLDGVWFPGAKGFGLDYGLMLGLGLTSFLDVVGGAEFVGYGFDFNHMPVDPTRAPILAGGATDRYESLFFGLRLSLGGTPPK